MESIKPLLMSLLTIGAVTIAGWTGTLASFSDTEISSGNYLEADRLDLKVGWDEYYNGNHIEHKDPTDDPGPIFYLDDIVPGDYGEATIILYVDSQTINPLVSMIIEVKSNDENVATDAEKDANDNDDNPEDQWDGELAQNINVVIWYDIYDEGDSDTDQDGITEYPGDNIQDPTEPVIYDGSLYNLVDPTTHTFSIDLDADPYTQVVDLFEPGKYYYIGFSWKLPSNVGDIVQTDTCTFDITFTATQT